MISSVATNTIVKNRFSNISVLFYKNIKNLNFKRDKMKKLFCCDCDNIFTCYCIKLSNK
jgi:hypothetical protein